MSNSQRKPPKRRPAPRPAKAAERSDAGPPAPAQAGVRARPAGFSAATVSPPLIATTAFFAGLGIGTAVLVGAYSAAKLMSPDAPATMAAGSDPLRAGQPEPTPPAAPPTSGVPGATPPSAPHGAVPDEDVPADGAVPDRRRALDEKPDSRETPVVEEEWPVEPPGQPAPASPPNGGDNGADNGAEPAPATDPFGDVAARGHVLPLPRREFQPGGEGTRSAELAQLLVSSPKDCNLTILGDQHVLDDVRFEVDAADEPGARTWTVRPKVPGVFVTPQPIGTFALKDGELAFTWNPRALAIAQPGHLRYCLLKLEVEGRSVRCRLSEPLEADPPNVDWNTTPPSAPIGITEAALPRAENLRLDLVPQGFPAHELAGASGMKVDDVGRLRVPDDAGGELRLVEMEVRFQLEPAPSLSFELFMYPRRTDGVGDKVTRDRARLTRNRLDALTREAKTAIEYCKKRILEATRHRDALNERMAKIDGEIAELTKARDKYRQWTNDEQLPMPQRDKADHARLKCDGQIKMLKENRRAVAHKRAALENEINGLNRRKTFAAENVAWCMRVCDALHEIENNGRMGFALYVEVEGERVDILRTRGN